MSVLTLEEAQADLARVAGRLRREEARALQEERTRLLRDLGSSISEADRLIERIEASHLSEKAGGEDILAQARGIRVELFRHIQAIAPEDAWFWTEEWQAGEREVDAQIAAGQGLVFDDDDALFAYLDRATGDDAHP